MIRRRCIICDKYKRTTNEKKDYACERCIKKVFWNMMNAPQLFRRWINKKHIFK